MHPSSNSEERKLSELSRSWALLNQAAGDKAPSKTLRRAQTGASAVELLTLILFIGIALAAAVSALQSKITTSARRNAQTTVRDNTQPVRLEQMRAETPVNVPVRIPQVDPGPFDDSYIDDVLVPKGQSYLSP